jgi:hypothetical protein
VAVRNGDGLLVPVAARRSRFAVENWLQEDGDMATMQEAAARPGWTCSDDACRMELKGYRVAYLREGADTARACRGVDILVTDFPLRGACRDVPVRIDRFDVWRHGSYAVFVRDGSIEVTTAAEHRGLRPWTTPPVLGLAVDLVDRHPETRLRPLLKPAPHRLAAGEQAAQVYLVVPAPRGLGLHHAQRRGRQEDIAHAVACHQREGLVRIELVEAARHHRARRDRAPAAAR